MQQQLADVLIVGGGPAGFSAALTLSRTLRKVVLFDSGVYRNANVKYMHNVSNFDGTSPTDYRNGMREELRKRYPDTFQYIPRKVLKFRKEDPTASTNRPTFYATDDQNQTWAGRKVILATGIEDILPPIQGFDTAWYKGENVVHCVFCHGTETKGHPIAVLLNKDLGPFNGKIADQLFQKFMNFKNKPVYLLANGIFGDNATEPVATEEYGITADLLKLISHHGFKWELGKVEKVTLDDSADPQADGHVPPPVTIHLANGNTVTVPFILYSPKTRAPQSTVDLLSDPSLSALASALGQPNPMFKVPMGEIPMNGFFNASPLEGVFVAGNAGLFMSTVAMSVSQGQMAAVGADNEIGMEDYTDAVKAADAAA